MRAAMYARYPSEMQSEASIEDQLRICRRLVADWGWEVVKVYHDMGISGAYLLRPRYQALLEDARHGHFDVLVGESIDRLSRDQEHIAALHKKMTYLGIPALSG
jgi:site-specific DNA recombinase